MPSRIIAPLAVGSVGLRVGGMVGMTMVLFEVGLLVEGAVGDVEELAGVAELVGGVEPVGGGIGELLDVAEVVVDVEFIGEVDVVETIDNFSKPAVTV